MAPNPAGAEELRLSAWQRAAQNRIDVARRAQPPSTAQERFRLSGQAEHRCATGGSTRGCDDEWVRCHDAATGASYYANRRSFEVSWTPPPAVALRRRRRWSPPRRRWPPRRRHERGAPPTRPDRPRHRGAGQGYARGPGRRCSATAAGSRAAVTAVTADSRDTPNAGARRRAVLRGVRRRRRAHRQRHRGQRFLRGVRGARGGGRGAGAQRPADAQGCHAGACRRGSGCAGRADARTTGRSDA